MWLLFALGSALFAGVTSILAKTGLQYVNSHLATALRTVIVALFAWIMVFIGHSQNKILEISPRGFLFLILSGLATGASWLCYFRALQLGAVSKVVAVDKSSTILTMLLAFTLLGESVTATVLGGMALMGIGTWIMVQNKPAATVSRTSNKWLLFAFLSAAFASITAILSKLGVQDVEPNLATAVRTMVVLVMSWLIVFSKNLQSALPKLDRRSWWFLLSSGVATGLSWLCYFHALQIGPVSIVVPIDKLSIVITVVFSVAFLKESVSRKAWAGLALIVAGTFLLLL